MNGMYSTARNIDGGTYPAQIWGEYMKKAYGKYCGDFKQPTEPFQSQPFFGHYSRSGKDETKSDDPATKTSLPTTPRRSSRARGARPATTAPATATAAGTAATTAATTTPRFDPEPVRDAAPGPADTESPGGGTQAPGDG